MNLLDRRTSLLGISLTLFLFFLLIMPFGSVSPNLIQSANAGSSGPTPTPVWTPFPVIGFSAPTIDEPMGYDDQNEITVPVNSAIYEAGSIVNFTCTRSHDYDYYLVSGSAPTYIADTISSSGYPKWTASAGSFGTNIGTSVSWTAPSTANGSVTISVAENDQPNSIPAGEGGSRDDAERIVDSRTIKVLKLEVLEPNFTPDSDANFVFDLSTEGICDVTPTGTTGVVSEDPNLTWDIDPISGSTLTMHDHPGPTPTLKFTGLPSSNAEFGYKNITMSHAAISDPEYGVAILFYNEGGENHPPDSEPNTPNWYYYWTKTSADTGPHVFDGNLSVDGRYYANDSNFRLGPNASGNDGGLVYRGTGIDNFGSTCLHEAGHMNYYLSTWMPHRPADDLDGDYLLDSQESGMVGVNGFPYNPLASDSNGDGVQDFEDYACVLESAWVIGTSDTEDWSAYGKQW